MKCFLRAKIHKAIITESNINYIGSITIDKNLLDKVGILENEKVLVTNNTNGNRLETYVIAGKKGEICMNGAAAFLMNPGDEIIIMAFEYSDIIVKPKVILVDEKNNFVQFLSK